VLLPAPVAKEHHMKYVIGQFSQMNKGKI